MYWQVQDHAFINYDDDLYVTDNKYVKLGLTAESIHWAFTTAHASNWHPVTWLSHILDYQFYGLNPQGHHLTSLFFHIANALILFLVLFRMTGASRQSGFVAAVFALHPLSVDSVAWVAERKNVLSTFFWLLTLWSYIRYVEKKNVKRYCLTALFLALGLMSKPMLVTLPFVLLLLDCWPLGRLKLGNKNEVNSPSQTESQTTFPRLTWEKVPLLALVAGSIFVTLTVQSGQIKSLDVYSLQDRVINALVSYLLYLQKAFWPSDLSILYPFPLNDLSVWKGLVCGLILVSITLIVLRSIRWAPYLSVGWFWYLGTLLPVIGIVQVGVQAMADRYAYVPLIGIFIMVAWGLPELLAKWPRRDRALTIAAGIYFSLLFVTTWVQVGHWKNSITIFKHAIDVTDQKYPGLAVTYNSLGASLSADGKKGEAIPYYRAAIMVKPDHARAYTNLGNALLAKRKTKEAIYHYKMAIKLKPGYSNTHYNLGIALSAEGKKDEAILHYKKAVKIKPSYAKAHNNLGNALLAKRKIKEAISHYKKAVQFRPDYPVAHNNLGVALSAKGKKEEAISHYKKAIKLKPDYAKAQNRLRKALSSVRQTE